MRVSFATAAVTSLPTLCLSLTARADIYNVTDLGAGVTPWAINASGEIVGGEFVGTTGMHAFSYSNGHVVDLGTLPGDATSVAFGINVSGQIVGGSGTNGGHAFLYQGGAMMPLGMLPGDTGSSAAGINDSGIVVGSSSHLETNGIVNHAFRYDGTMHDLGSLGGTSTVASAINTSGLIVGKALPPDEPFSLQYHAVMFAPTITDINDRLWGESAVFAVNDGGDVVGFFVPSGIDRQQAFLRSADGTIHRLGTPDGFDRSEALAVNSADDAVGFVKAGQSGPQDAALFSGGQALDLNNLIPANSGWVLQSATAINDSGQIVGGGELNGVPHGFLLTLPEPSTAALLLCVMPAALRRRRPR